MHTWLKGPSGGVVVVISVNMSIFYFSVLFGFYTVIIHEFCNYRDVIRQCNGRPVVIVHTHEHMGLQSLRTVRSRSTRARKAPGVGRAVAGRVPGAAVRELC